MEFEQKIVRRNFLSQLQEFYPYCIEDTDKSIPEGIVQRINLENEEDENFKNRYSAVSNTNWIVYRCTPNPQRMPQKLMLDVPFSEPPQRSTSSSYSSYQQMSEANCMEWVSAVVIL
ncbi:hypothetical protein TNCV_2023961 [Trichonephila clavipes]|nr:hypothetical protein TNCV_2023961 [Trichonephila clavipes]